jgi:TolA-binding protein
LLRRGEAARAAAAFDEVARAAGEGGVAEDASYWRAVALVRAGDGQARAALAAFIERFPASPRVGEASVILGWSLLRAGELEPARAAFARGAGDPADRVRAGARDGLRQIDARAAAAAR